MIRTATAAVRPALIRSLLLALCALTLGACDRRQPADAGAGAPEQPPTYVGGAQCAGCHAAQVDLWKRSHHALAMLPADAKTVLADFNDTHFVKDGVQSSFFRRGEEFWVRTDGTDGKLAEFRVAYTFGATPLQQYLLELPAGRLQALSIVWDTRPKEQGGQRWFHLYPEEKIDHRDVLHWAGPAHNWNHMCADCHSTNLQKNYDAAEDRFDTTWSDVNVSCESCHGPASRHVEWARQPQREDGQGRGFAFVLDDFSAGRWTFPEGQRIARRNAPLGQHAEVETCGRCHSRRAQIWPEAAPGEPLEQTHRVALLEDGLYHADGQIRDEVYEYGSFLQSRMYAEGVTCSNCHEPHSGQLRAPGNLVCAQCHVPAHYDSPDHHHHAAQTAAAQCVSCHMTERNYMVIDGRRDHSFRVPRPDQSRPLGTPNACNDCHANRDPQWASAAIDRWYGTERTRGARFAQALHAGRTSAAGAERALLAVAADSSESAIARASAISLLSGFLSERSVSVVLASLQSPEPLLRRSALEALDSLEPQARASFARPLLEDHVRSVRLEALGAVLDAEEGQAGEEQEPTASLQAVIREYRAVQAFNADRADAQVNLGQLEARLGNVAASAAAYERAIALQPSFVPAYLSLAELHRTQGREEAVGQVLERGLATVPEAAALHESLGLSYVRQKRLGDAVSELSRAAALAPEVPRYAYIQAIALRQSDKLREALSVLAAAHRRHPADRAILVALIEYHLEAGERAAALRWAATLERLDPADPRTRELLQQLGR